MINDLFKLEKKIKDGMQILIEIRDELKASRALLEELRDIEVAKVRVEQDFDDTVNLVQQKVNDLFNK